MPKSTTLCNDILNLIYRAVAIADFADNDATSPQTLIWARLHTASLTPSATQSTSETAYTNYAAVSIPRTTGGWNAPSGGQIQNTASVEFAQCGVTGATIVAASLGKAASGAGQILHYGDLNAPIAVSNQIQPRFAAGAMTVTEA
jgi:hypothetical protein